MKCSQPNDNKKWRHQMLEKWKLISSKTRAVEGIHRVATEVWALVEALASIDVSARVFLDRQNPPYLVSSS